jgi:hypothetical protein
MTVNGQSKNHETSIQYYFTFDDGLELKFDVDLDRSFDPKRISIDAPEWTRLGNNQCSNCPLNKAEVSIVLLHWTWTKWLATFRNYPHIPRPMCV